MLEFFAALNPSNPTAVSSPFAASTGTLTTSRGGGHSSGEAAESAVGGLGAWSSVAPAPRIQSRQASGVRDAAVGAPASQRACQRTALGGGSRHDRRGTAGHAEQSRDGLRAPSGRTSPAVRPPRRRCVPTSPGRSWRPGRQPPGRCPPATRPRRPRPTGTGSRRTARDSASPRVQRADGRLSRPGRPVEADPASNGHARGAALRAIQVSRTCRASRRARTVPSRRARAHRCGELGEPAAVPIRLELGSA